MLRITLSALLLLTLLISTGCEDTSAKTRATVGDSAALADDRQGDAAETLTHAVSQEPVGTTPSPQPNNAVGIAVAQPPSTAYIVIQNAKPADPQLLIRQLQQVLPETQVVTQTRSPNPREIKLQVTNIKDLKALANKIPFAPVESIDLQTRTITVDFDL
jgi:hypothetical protein